MKCFQFQSTRPRGARPRRTRRSPLPTRFNPRARAGRDDCRARVSIHAPARDEGRSGRFEFQSTRPRGARRRAPASPCWAAPVSIHAPRAGRDRTAAIRSSRSRRVSIHAPARGATRRVRDREIVEVSIHAPARGATRVRRVLLEQRTFQSTRPARGATRRADRVPLPRRVSIHAPRAGRDVEALTCASSHAGFNPRAPRGARRDCWRSRDSVEYVSIHAPRAGRDCATRNLLYLS